MGYRIFKRMFHPKINTKVVLIFYDFLKVELKERYSEEC